MDNQPQIDKNEQVVDTGAQLSTEEQNTVENANTSADNDDETTILLAPDSYEIIDSTIKLDQIVVDKKKLKEIIDIINNFYIFNSNDTNAQAFKDNYAYNNGLMIMFCGVTGCGKTMLTYALANHFKKKLLIIKFNNGIDSEYYFEDKIFNDASHNLKMIMDIAKKNDAIILIDEADKNEERKHNLERIMGCIDSYDGICLLTSNSMGICNGPLLRRINYIYRFLIPNAKDQALIWQKIIPSKYKNLFKNIDFDYLSQTYNFTGGQIKNIVQSVIMNCYGKNKKTITIDMIESVANEASKQIFMQYHASSMADSDECYYTADKKKSSAHSSSFKSIVTNIESTKLYKKHLDTIVTAVKSYDSYKKARSLSNSLSNVHLNNGRLTIINSPNTDYCKHIFCNALDKLKMNGRFIAPAQLFDESFIPHPLTREDVRFIFGISEPILGRYAPTVIVDNDVCDIINKFINDLNIISNKISNRPTNILGKIMTSVSDNELNSEDNDEDNQVLSCIGDLILKWLAQGYNDAYILTNTSKFKDIMKYIARIDNIFFINLDSKTDDGKYELFKSIIQSIHDKNLTYDKDCISKIIDEKKVKELSVLSINNLVLNTYNRVIINPSAYKGKTFKDKFYTELESSYKALSKLDNMPYFA